MIDHPNWTEMVHVFDDIFSDRLEKHTGEDGNWFVRSSILLPPTFQNQEQPIPEIMVLISESILNWLPQAIMETSTDKLDLPSVVSLVSDVTRVIVREDLPAQLHGKVLVPTNVKYWETGDLERIGSPLYEFVLSVAVNKTFDPPMMASAEINCLTQAGTKRESMALSLRMIGRE